MKFSEKLNAYMSITGTTNVALADYINVDASLLGRWRSGKRPIKSTSEYLLRIASFIVKRDLTEREKEELLKIGLPYSSLHDAEEKKNFIAKWLGAEPLTGQAGVRPISSDLGNVMEKLSIAESYLRNMSDTMLSGFKKVIPVNDTLEGEECSFTLYEGMEGKRKAVLRMLFTLLYLDAPSELLCFSDESMEWLMGDRVFFLKWSELMKAAIAKGNRIKIIHVLNRGPSEIMSAIEQWAPLHLTGMLESYYMPRYTARILKNTLFVIPKVIACTAQTTNPSGLSDSTHITTHQRTVQDMENLFQGYLVESKQYFKLFKAERIEPLLNKLLEIEQTYTNTLTYKDSLPDVTMPESVLFRLCERAGLSSKDTAVCIDYHAKRVAAFQKSIKNFSTTHLLAYDNMASLLKMHVLYPVFGAEAVFYEPLDLYEHLNHTIRMLKTYDRFNVFLVPSQQIGFGANTSFIAKDGFGAVLSKWDENNANPLTLLTSEPISSTVFYGILKNAKDNIPEENKIKDQVVSRLETTAYNMIHEYKS